MSRRTRELLTLFSALVTLSGWVAWRSSVLVRHSKSAAQRWPIDVVEGSRFCFTSEVPPPVECITEALITERAAANHVRSTLGLAPLRVARRSERVDSRALLTSEDFSSKCLRRKLCDRRPILTELEDKWRGRQILVRLLGEANLPRLLAAATAVENIDFAKLPENYVIKVNHWAGGRGVMPMQRGVDLKSGLRTSVPQIKRTMRALLEARGFSVKHLYRRGKEHRFEWAVARICPRVVYVEELLAHADPSQLLIPIDVKILCFNGRAEVIEVLTNRSALDGEMRQVWYNREWREFSAETTMRRLKHPIRVPKLHLDRMLRMADTVAAALLEESGVEFIRIDFLLAYDGPKAIEFSTTPGSCGSTEAYFTKAPHLMRYIGSKWKLPTFAS